MLQPIETLCRRLGDAGYEVNIETNGAAALFLERPDRLFYTMDIKSPSSGEKDRMRWENLSLLTADDVLKFVVGSVEDLRYMETTLAPIPSRPKFTYPLFLVRLSLWRWWTLSNIISFPASASRFSSTR